MSMYYRGRGEDGSGIEGLGRVGYPHTRAAATTVGGTINRILRSSHVRPRLKVLASFFRNVLAR
jgi:hypothetical protein